MDNLLTWILGLIAAYLAVKWQSSAKENETLKQKLSEKKEKLYADFIHMYFSLMNKGPQDQDKLVKEMRDFNERIILVGSNKVILTFGDFMQCLYKTEAKDTRSMMRLFGELILAMREDIGHKDFFNSLYWFDTLRPWIKDIDKMVPDKYVGIRRRYNKIVNPK